METTTDLEKLARNVAKAMPDLDDTAQRLAVGLYRRLAEGEPVSPAELARRLDLSPDLVAEGLCFGLAARETRVDQRRTRHPPP